MKTREVLAAIGLLGIASCDGSSPTTQTAINAASGTGSSAAPISISAVVNSTRFVTREHMLAAGEMQISGEPFAEAMGRDLSNYYRNIVPTDLYLDLSLQRFWIDLPGFSTAVESYEYSKQPMNNLGFESSAGTSLVYGPLVNPDGASGADATALMAALVQHFSVGSNAQGRFIFPQDTYPENNRSGNVNPNGFGVASNNPLGWPGIWPTTHVFADFDPAIDPSGTQELACALTSDDGTVGESDPTLSSNYECDASTLHLRDRASQINSIITPGADGFSGWKYGLWVLNYLQVMHDSIETAINTVAPADLPNVGTPGNMIVGDATISPGAYLGSSDIEGFQAQMFIEEMDNRAEDWLSNLTTADGTTLTGFASIEDALAYNDSSPLRWFPSQIAVSESDDGRR